MFNCSEEEDSNNEGGLEKSLLDNERKNQSKKGKSQE